MPAAAGSWNRCATSANAGKRFAEKGTPVKVDVADRQFQGIEDAWVVDRSAGGLGLHMDSPLPRGAVLKVRPRQAPGSDMWVLMVVMNCRQEDDYYVVGCQFGGGPARRSATPVRLRRQSSPSPPSTGERGGTLLLIPAKKSFGSIGKRHSPW